MMNELNKVLVRHLNRDTRILIERMSDKSFLATLIDDNEFERIQVEAETPLQALQDLSEELELLT